jgi:hypothetical protein
MEFVEIGQNREPSRRVIDVARAAQRAILDARPRMIVITTGPSGPLPSSPEEGASGIARLVRNSEEAVKLVGAPVRRFKRSHRHSRKR